MLEAVQIPPCPTLTWLTWPRAGSTTCAPSARARQPLRIYRAGVRAYVSWCEENGQPAILDRNLLAAFTADLLDRGAEPATAQARHLAMRTVRRWLHAEGELAEDARGAAYVGSPATGNATSPVEGPTGAGARS